jgi:hypothetical protein
MEATKTVSPKAGSYALNVEKMEAPSKKKLKDINSAFFFPPTADWEGKRVEEQKTTAMRSIGKKTYKESHHVFLEATAYYTSEVRRNIQAFPGFSSVSTCQTT